MIDDVVKRLKNNVLFVCWSSFFSSTTRSVFLDCVLKKCGKNEIKNKYYT